jgi:hypothetical protein
MSVSQPVGPAFPDGIPVTNQQIIVDGRHHLIQLPQRYYDWSFIMAHFPAPTRHVKTLVPVESLHPVEIAPTLAVITLAAFEYRRMATLAPYNEVAIMVPVRYQPRWDIPFLPLLCPDRFDVGFWVHHLPVDTQEACDAGVSVWGLPKVVATEIRFDDIGWMRQCELEEDGEHVLTLSAAMGETRLESRRFYAYSLLHGQLLKSLVDTRAHYHAWYAPQGGASVTLGTHQIARDLRDLGMHNAAIAGLFAFTAKSRLHPGEVLTAEQPAASGVGLL